MDLPHLERIRLFEREGAVSITTRRELARLLGSSCRLWVLARSAEVL